MDAGFIGLPFGAVLRRLGFYSGISQVRQNVKENTENSSIGLA
jgi:hypothetical protein